MNECKYFKMEDDARNFELARSGYFMALGMSGGDSVAIVKDKQTGRLFTTYIDYVQITESHDEVLIDKLTQLINEYVARIRRDAATTEMLKLFKEFGSK